MKRNIVFLINHTGSARLSRDATKTKWLSHSMYYSSNIYLHVKVHFSFTRGTGDFLVLAREAGPLTYAKDTSKVQSLQVAKW